MTKTKWQLEGYTKVSFRDNSCVSLRLADFEAAVELWKKGATFGTFIGVYGYSICIKFAEVNCIMECTPASMEMEDADNKLEEYK